MTTSSAEVTINYDFYIRPNYLPVIFQNQPIPPGEVKLPSTTAKYEDLLNWLKSTKSTFKFAEIDINNILEEPCTLENQLAAMAQDPEIQSELKKINNEFAITELDGLENL